jgi:UDP-N-acetylmuramoyl-tripeptide--D-alanyl-D-alanine ligase
MTTTEELYQLYKKHPVISTDTRKIAPGSIFFALKGDKFDANTFAEQAIAAGAAYAVIDDPSYRLGQQYLLVGDVLDTLQELARHHRGQLRLPVIGLTGTNGKTTTKELINSVLSQRFCSYATQGNLNNHIGVPLTILSINSSHQAAVIEMGANHQKEIELLCSISRPSHGLITNVGKAHLEGFGGIEGVKKGKGELYDFMKASGGVTFVNSDSAELMTMQYDRALKNVIFYGSIDLENLVCGQMMENSPYLMLQWTNNATGESYQVRSQLTGAYNRDKRLAAICIGVYFKLDPQEINRGISGYQPKNNRSQITTTASNTLICDYYNANPSSMFVAIENVGKIKAGHKVLVLGDMFEMGQESPAEHQAVIKKALETPVDERIFIGGEFAAHKSVAAGHGAIFYETIEQAIAGLKASPIKNATVLIKGSRGMALERLVELF